ncbi:hypothetical protein ABKN59_007140 [Abortiporus biennis]
MAGEAGSLFRYFIGETNEPLLLTEPTGESTAESDSEQQMVRDTRSNHDHEPTHMRIGQLPPIVTELPNLPQTEISAASCRVSNFRGNTFISARIYTHIFPSSIASVAGGHRPASIDSASDELAVPVNATRMVYAEMCFLYKEPVDNRPYLLVTDDTADSSTAASSS